MHTILLHAQPDFGGDSGSYNNPVFFGLFVLTAIVILIMAFFHTKEEKKKEKLKPTINSRVYVNLEEDDDDLEDYIPGLDELRDPDYNYNQ